MVDSIEELKPFKPFKVQNTQNNFHSEYYTQMDMYPPAITTVVPPAAKAVKKVRNNAIAIVDPKSGKNIMEDFLSASATPPDVTSPAVVAAVVPPTELKVAPPVVVEEIEKAPTVEVEEVAQVAPPSTPVVSANTDGPSVDITPKHQVRQGKCQKFQ